jgi:RHS repeat-associated protein
VADKVADDSSPFSQQVFENSPLQRVLKSGMVGVGFQPVGGTGTQYYKTASYRSNASASDGNIIMWGPDGTNQGTYADNMLSVTDGKDEDGVETLNFTDLKGQVILKRQKNSATNIDTYYIYNNAGAVSYVIPPLALKTMVANSNYDPNQAVVSKLVFKYVYDDRGRVVEKTVPGAGVIYLVYDPLNRLVLVQDAKLRAANQWNYIKYDIKDHPVSQGIYTNNTLTSRPLMQTYVTTTIASDYDVTWYESRTASSFDGYYTNSVFPKSGLTPLAYSYYDDYDLDGNGTANWSYTAQSLPNEAAQTSLPIKGIPTMVRTRTVGTGAGINNIWLLKVMFYDKSGNLIQTKSNNQLNYTANTVTDYSTSVPDFTGMPIQTKVTKVTGTTAAPVTTSVLTTMTYDHMYRVKALTQSYNGATATKIAAYTYNELGQLVDKQLHNVSGTTYLQSIDYRYNIRGQVTSINNSKLNNDSGTTNTNDDTNDLFGMLLLYDKTDANLVNTPWFNGKLSAVKWMSRDASGAQSNERSYRYFYDSLDRYYASVYKERSVGGTGGFSLNLNGFNENGITYDDGGNLLTLYRNGSSVGGSGPAKIDSLTYTYDPNNPYRLKTVTDGTTSNYTGYGFRNLSGTTTGTYTYDPNGNLTADPYKALTLSYNLINRTDKIIITSATGRYIAYTYDAGGQLLRKQAFDNSTIQNTTDYIDGFAYVNGVISYFAMPEGRVRNTGSGSTVTLKPEYIISDQQGNARVSFEESSTTPGTAVVRQENSYYGFGLVMPNSPVATPTADNKQLYNGGSEWQNDFGNLPDYYQTFYRNFDAALGRFIGVDPQAESAESLTSYNYAGNNPIVYNDPMGNYPSYVYFPDYSNPGGGQDFFSKEYDSQQALQDKIDNANNVQNMDNGTLFNSASQGDALAVQEYGRRNGISISAGQLTGLTFKDGQPGYYNAVGLGFYNADHTGVKDETGYYVGDRYTVWGFTPLNANAGGMAPPGLLGGTSNPASWVFTPAGPDADYQTAGVSGILFHELKLEWDPREMGVKAAIVIMRPLYFELPRVTSMFGKTDEIMSSAWAAGVSAGAVNASIRAADKAWDNSNGELNQYQLGNIFLQSLRTIIQSVGGRVSTQPNYPLTIVRPYSTL